VDRSIPPLAQHSAPASDEERTRRALLHMLEDLQREREAIRDARRSWVDTVDAVGDPMLVHDADFRIVRCNRAYAARAGVGFSEIIGRPYWECFPKLQGVLEAGLEGQPAGRQGVHEIEFSPTPGEFFVSRAFPLSREPGSHTLHLFEEVTARHRAAAHGQALLDVSASRAISDGEVETVAREITEAASRATGVARANVWLFNEAEDELRCIDHYEAGSGAHAAGMVLRENQFRNEFEALKRAPYVDASEPLTDPRTAGYVEGYLKPNAISSMLDVVVQVSGKHLGMLCLEHVGRAHAWQPDEIAFATRLADKVAMALSSRTVRRAEDAMRQSEKRFRTIFETAPIGISESSLTGAYVRVNQQLCDITGFSAAELQQRTFRDITHPEDLTIDERGLGMLLAGVIPVHSVEKRYIRKDGKIIWAALLVTPVRDTRGTIEYLVTIVKDISARKQAEAEISALARFPAENPNPVMRVDGSGVLLYANPASSEFLRACGGKVGERVPEPCETLARASLLSASSSEEEMMFGERIYGVVFSSVPGAGYVNVYAADITARRRAEATLREALVATVEAIAATVETRDPYTAGHQRRVATLAAAIATEMGLPPGAVEGIHFGALIHDLGKMQVPSELLSKPTKLSRLEFELIKTHPQAGYEIVKGIKFPWPVAEMVHQHHERLDGSGYPQGLKGDAIAPEARILAVADVVEAMSSHRPYRPGLGIESALKEIEAKRGTWFDPVAVDACLRLFREKGFTLESGVRS
jgi:PAS domain S-box-containing protein/putative nucleotidyltransferase with HDIG domain